MSDLAGRIALVVGASRGFGRGIAEALAAADAEVHALARSDLSELVRASGGRIRRIAADATDPVLAPRVLRELKPNLVVLNAGAAPEMAPIQDQTWESFSVNWNTDVKIAFHWITAALREPLARGSSVVALSSGAVLHGSPLSGGYAGAKAMIRFLTQYAADESSRAKLGIQFVALLPSLTPATNLGRAAVEAYARRSGRTAEEALTKQGAPLTTAAVGAAVIRLVLDPARDEHRAFRLDAGGMTPLN